MCGVDGEQCLLPGLFQAGCRGPDVPSECLWRMLYLLTAVTPTLLQQALKLKLGQWEVAHQPVVFRLLNVSDLGTVSEGVEVSREGGQKEADESL